VLLGVMAGVLFVSSAKWNKGRRAAQPLAVPAGVLALAFGSVLPRTPPLTGQLLGSAFQ
jgi:hypothetical protein